MKPILTYLSIFMLCTFATAVPLKAQLQKGEKMTEETIVILETNHGMIEIKLFPEIAPKTCENFVGLINKGYYNGITFHRIIKNFMIQGGDPTGTGRGGESLWGKPFKDEVHPDIIFDRPGLLAMANAGPNTNGSQFFITVVPTPWLNMNHTIFGEVINGMDAVKKIENSENGAKQTILKAYIKTE